MPSAIFWDDNGGMNADTAREMLKELPRYVSNIDLRATYHIDSGWNESSRFVPIVLVLGICGTQERE